MRQKVATTDRRAGAARRPAQTAAAHELRTGGAEGGLPASCSRPRPGRPASWKGVAPQPQHPPPLAGLPLAPQEENKQGGARPARAALAVLPTGSL